MPIARAFELFPAMSTKRLTLRRIGLGDTDAIFALYSTEDVAQYLDIDTLVDQAGAQALAEFFVRSYDERFAIRWGITLLGDDRLIGTCVYNGLDEEDRRAEIGFDLMPTYWRQGITSEAVHAILHYAFTGLELNRVEAVVSPGNVASQALLMKSGFVKEGYLRQRAFYRGSFHDDVIYGLLGSEWLETRWRGGA